MEILAASCESTGMNETQSAGEGSSLETGTWITHNNKLSDLGKSTLGNPNLKRLGIEYYISAEDLGRTFVAAVDTNKVQSKDQDEKRSSRVPAAADLIVFELRRDFDERADCAGRVGSLINLIPDALCF